MYGWPYSRTPYAKLFASPLAYRTSILLPFLFLHAACPLAAQSLDKNNILQNKADEQAVRQHTAAVVAQIQGLIDELASNGIRATTPKSSTPPRPRWPIFPALKWNGSFPRCNRQATRPLSPTPNSTLLMLTPTRKESSSSFARSFATTSSARLPTNCPCASRNSAIARPRPCGLPPMSPALPAASRLLNLPPWSRRPSRSSRPIRQRSVMKPASPSSS